LRVLYHFDGNCQTKSGQNKLIFSSYAERCPLSAVRCFLGIMHLTNESLFGGLRL